MSYQLSKKEILKEVIKSGKDPNYFINNYAKISHPIKGLIPFKTYDFQTDLIQDFNDYRFTVILKARQLGISTITAAYIAWMMMFHRDKNVLVIATKFSTAANLVKKVKHMIKNLPEWIQMADIAIDNRASFELSNGSQFKASSTSADAGRSEALSLLVIDEAAHVEGLEDLWTGLYPTLSTGGRCIALSTPNGVGNWFHQIYIDAEQEKNDFHHVILPWDVHPERDQEWFENETKNMSRRQIAQELECVRAQTRIVTPQGFKYIEDINIGDKVLTHKGRFKKVIRLYNKNVFKEDMVKVSLPMSRKNPIYITKNHPVKTIIKNEQKGQSIYGFLKCNRVKQEWMSFGELEGKYGNYRVPQHLNAIMPVLKKEILTGETERLDLSIYPYNKNLEKETEYVRYFRQKGKTKRWLDINYDFGRLIGLYLSEGNKTENRVQFSFHKEEKELIDFISQFAISQGMRVWIGERKYSNCTVVIINNKFLSSAIDEFVDGLNCYTKLLREDIYKTNLEFIKGIVDGTWQGDGYHKPKDKNVLVMANEKLIYQIRLLMTMFGLLTRVSFNHKSGKGGSWYIELNNVENKTIEMCTDHGIEYKKGQRCKKYNNLWWGRARVEPPEDLDELTTVYNIEVEEDNSYVCENLVVHNCNFNMSGETVVHGDDMQRIKKGLQDPKYRTSFDRNFWIWEEYKEESSYLLVADVARGDGKDYSVFHIFKLETMEIIAEYQSRVAPDMFSRILFDAGKEYGDCMLIVENNSVGFAVLEKLKDMQYPNIYHSIKSSHEYVDESTAESKSNAVAGFTTSSKTRPLIVAKMEEFIRNKLITIYSNRLFRELETFIWNHGRPEAMRMYNDDLTIALAIGCWVKDTVLETNKRDIEYSRAFLSVMTRNSTTLDTTVEGMTGHKSIKNREAIKEQQQYIALLKG